jgi:hypothetical protein
MDEQNSGHEGLAAREGAETRRVLVISRRGPPARPFGWEIRDGSGEITRSLATFQARDEAVADGQRELNELQASSLNI